MAVNPLYKRDLLTLSDLNPEEFELILDTAARFKRESAEGTLYKYLNGKQIAVILQKESLRTRVSFEAGISQLGGNCILLTGSDSAFSRGEPVSDTAGVLDGYVDAIVLRTYADALIEELADFARIPVFNALTDLHHPFQGLADMLTIREQFGSFEGLRVAYVGDGSNNMAHTYVLAGALCGIEIVISSPAKYQPDIDILDTAKEIAVSTGAKITLEENATIAVQDAQVVITDTFTSMGQEAEHGIRLQEFASYQVNAALFECAADDAVFMHCLPAHRGEEVTPEVIDGERSLIYPQAENRLYAQQAVLALALNERL